MDAPAEREARSEMAQVEAKKEQQVKVKVDYLPATEDLKRDYKPETLVETVRADAKSFFGVQDRQERDTYFYYLTHNGQRIQDTNTALGQLIGPHPHAAH